MPKLSRPSLRSDADRNALALANRGLVGFALRCRALSDNLMLKYADRDDIEQWGWLGLLRAAELYDPTRIGPKTGQPYRFSTMAVHWIIQYIQRGLYKNSGREDRRRAGASMTPFSAFGERGYDPPDNRPAPPLEFDQRDAVRDLLRVLVPHERAVIEHRFFQGDTLEETGAIMGITRERVRQLEVKALDRLRRWCRRQGLDWKWGMTIPARLCTAIEFRKKTAPHATEWSGLK